MIRFLQKKGLAQKILFAAIVGATSLFMVITLIPGIQDFSGSAPGLGMVAKVGGQEISAQQVDQLVSMRLRRESIPEQFIPLVRPTLVKQAVDQLVAQQVMVLEAERLGFRVTDEELREFLQTMWRDELFPGGKFIGQLEYERIVSSSYNMSVVQFENDLKRQLLINKLASTITDGVTVTPQEIEQEYRRQNTKVKLKYAVLSPASLMKEIQPTEEELRAYFEKNKQRYAAMDPERRKIQYTVITPDQVNIQVTPEELQRAYNQRREEYRTPEEVDVSHILIAAPGPSEQGKEAEVEGARKKAQDLLDKIKGGANFAQLARQHSDDPGSKEEGGSYKAMRRGTGLDPEFERAAFNSPEGLVPELVRSSFGFHIIRVDDKREAKMRPLAEVEDELRQLVRQEKSARALEDLANTLQREIRPPNTFEQAAQKHGLQPITTGLITRMDSLPGIGQAPDVMQSIFSAKERGGPVVARSPQGYVVFEVLEVQQPVPPTFEQIRGRVESEFRQERAGQLMQQRAQELADRARAEASLEKAAKELGATVKTSEFVGANDAVPDIGQLGSQAEFALGMQPGNISDPIQAAGNAVVLSVIERQEPNMENLEAVRQRLRDEVAAQKRERVFGIFVSQLRDRLQAEGKIRLNQQEIDRMTATGTGGRPRTT